MPTADRQVRVAEGSYNGEPETGDRPEAFVERLCLSGTPKYYLFIRCSDEQKHFAAVKRNTRVVTQC